MRKLLIISCFMMITMVIYAQEKAVSGKITDENGQGLPGASVIEKGTNNGIISDREGNYKLSVKESATLAISFIGYETQEVLVGGQSIINVQMVLDVEQLEEIVVTAFGIEREKKSLGYAVTEVQGEPTARESSFITNLSGKVAGVQINKGGSGIGSPSRVVIRGNSSVSGSNQPLYVIDGIPLDNTNYGTPGEFNGYDSGDGLINLNPDDIESISVLKGPNAGALYGSRAANGVILITTKSAKPGKDFGVTLNFNAAYESPTVPINRQSEYGQGAEGAANASQDVSWGAKLSAAPNDVVDDFLNTGQLLNTSVSIVNGTERSQTRISYANTNNQGLIPNSELIRNSFSIKNTTKLGEKLKFNGKLNYVNQELNNRPQSGETDNSWASALKTPVGIGTAQLKDFFKFDDDGNEYQNLPGNNPLAGNPYWFANRVSREENRDRIIALASIDYQITKNLSLLLRSGLDTYRDNVTNSFSAGSKSASDQAVFDRGDALVREFNNDFLLRYDGNLDDFQYSVSFGGSIRTNLFNLQATRAANLEIPNFFVGNNSKNLTSSGGFSRKEVQSLYGLAQLGYKGYLFLDITGRNDWSSTLPEANNSFFYPSISASAVISDMFQTRPEFLTFAKVRASYAQVGSDIPPFLNVQTYGTVAAIGGVGLKNQDILANSDFKPESVTSFEIGIDLRLFSDRIGFDFTYYKSNSTNQYLLIPQRASSGFAQRGINSGNIENTGLEFLLRGTPIKSNNLTWDISFTLSQNKNKVIELSEESDIQFLSTNRAAQIIAKKGGSLGDVYVTGYQRNDKGQVIVDDKGLPSKTSGFDILAGNIAPDWLGGISNTLTFGNFDFNFLIDFRLGGVVVSHTQAVLAGRGLSEQTVADRDGFIFDGVNADGTPNNVPITAEQFWKKVGGRAAPYGEVFTYDADNVRLRQVGLGYTLPSKLFDNSPIQNIKVSLYGRNLLFLFKDAPFDPEVALSSTSDGGARNRGANLFAGQGVDFFSQPATRSFGFNVKVEF